jgi:hypothetical protein
MVQLDIPAAFAASLLFLDFGRSTVKRAIERGERGRSTTYYRFLARSALFAGAVIAPAGIYLLSGWPGWEQIYWSRRFEEVMHTGWVNALLPALFVVAIMLGAYFGHVLGYRWLAGGKEKYLRPTWIAVLGVFVIIVLLCYPSFLHVGTYDQYHNLHGQSREAMGWVWENPYGFSAGWTGVMVYFVVALAYLLLKIRKESKRA